MRRILKLLKAGQRRKSRHGSLQKLDRAEVIQFPKAQQEPPTPEDHPDHDTVSRWLKLADEMLRQEDERKKA